MIKLSELFDTEATAKFEAERVGSLGSCCLCHAPFTLADKLSEEITIIKEGFAHADCCFELLGQILEDRPIGPSALPDET